MLKLLSNYLQRRATQARLNAYFETPYSEYLKRKRLEAQQ
jgi:hypothetical protein